MAAFDSGEIILVDWRGDGLPREANKLRPCVVVEDGDLFDGRHPSVIVVPLTTDREFVMPTLATTIEPDATNGFSVTSFAASHAVVTAAKSRVVQRPGKRVSYEQLASIRRQVAESIGYYKVNG